LALFVLDVYLSKWRWRFVLISFWGAGKALLPIILGQIFIKFPLSFVYAWIGLMIVNKAKNIRAAEKPIGYGWVG